MKSLRFITLKNFLIFFILGAILGPLCDGFHSHQGILYYPKVWEFKMAWWVPFLFGGATLSIAYSHTHLDLIFFKKIKTLPWNLTYLALLSFIGMYFLSSILNFSTLINSVLLYSLAILCWFLFNRTLFGFIIALLTAITGSLVEISLIYTENFFYFDQYSHFLGIPYWLPALYIAASIGVGAFGRKVCSIDFKN
jgi:MFS family permease